MTSPRRILGAVCFASILLGAAAPLAAQETGAETPPGLMWLDWIIIGAYVLTTLAVGAYYGMKQESADEYFVGNRRMNPLLIGVSLFATLLSTISYLSMPGEALGKGPVWMLSITVYPLVFLIVGYFILPLYMQYRVTTAYELLEKRLGLSVRLLGACMFLSLRLVWMSLLVYMSAKAMTVMTGIDDKWIPGIAAVTSVVAITYTTLGGLRAVVVTDLMQTILLYGGALMVLGCVTWRMGGFGWVPTQWNENWDSQPIFSFDVSTRITIFGTLLSVLLWQVCTAGGDQTTVQRFMATKDAAAARWAIFTQLTVGAVVGVTLALVGFSLLGYFTRFPDQLPPDITLKANADQIFPHFIAYHLPIGVSGLVVSAMFAAAMSSVDSGVNSITAVVMTDFVERLGGKSKDDQTRAFYSRVLALAIGIIVVAGSCFIGEIPGNFTAMTNKTVNLLTTPIFCLFFFALFVPFASSAAVWLGSLAGVGAAALVAFSGPLMRAMERAQGVAESQLTEGDPISFQWIAPAALVANLAVGFLACWVFPRKDKPPVPAPKDDESTSSPQSE